MQDQGAAILISWPRTAAGEDRAQKAEAKGFADLVRVLYIALEP